MEINHYGDTILGVVTAEAITEGRMVILTNHSVDVDWGSRTDLPGARLPDTAAEANRARYCITFAVDNRPTPIMEGAPSFTWALRRGGWDQAQTFPFSATIYLTHPSNQEGLTIASGSLALAFGEGIYTVPSGAYVYSAAVEVPGTQLSVANTADDGAADAGKLIEQAGAENTVAEVVRYHSDGHLTFKILH